MSEYVDMNRPPPDLLQNKEIDLGDSAKRKQWEAQKRAEAQQNQQPQPQAATLDPVDENDRVFLVNNMARPVHIPAGPGHPDLILDGQLAVSAKGPFDQISRKSLNANYMLQDLLTQPVSKKNPALRGKTKVQEIDELTFRRLRAEYQKRKLIREAEYSREENNVARHEDGTIDADDAGFELTKIRPNIIRAQG